MVASANLDLESQNWLVNDGGECLPLDLKEEDLPDKPYRLYRFLTELEDILDDITDTRDRICAIIPLVRKLLTSSYWLQMEFSEPPLDPGWSVEFLYDEYEFPLTVQMVAWLPGNVSPIHNHATWGIVAVVNGQEKNQFWKRNPNPKKRYSNGVATRSHIELVGEKVLVPGDIIGFTPDAIHCVEPVGDEPAVTFNLYGVTDFPQRFEFDPISQTATNF